MFFFNFLGHFAANYREILKVWGQIQTRIYETEFIRILTSQKRHYILV